jgi:hypothetical protein
MFDGDFDMEEQTSEADKEGNDLNVKVEESCDPRPQTNDVLPNQRLCPGHERALPIQQTVMDLDVKEEGTIIN